MGLKRLSDVGKRSELRDAGRRNTLPDDPKAPIVMRINRLVWLDHAYDSEGVYWGMGGYIFWAYADDVNSDVEVFERASTVEQAIVAVQAKIPGASFIAVKATKPAKPAPPPKRVVPKIDEDGVDRQPRYAPTEVYCKMRRVPVVRTVVHPVGTSPKTWNRPRAGWSVLECVTENGSVCYEVESAWINAELRMVVIGTPGRDEVRMQWPVVAPRNRAGGPNPALRGLTPDQITMLVRYAQKHGRMWKSDLRLAWETGDYGSDRDDGADLQTLRNSGDFGPSGLIRFRLPK